MKIALVTAIAAFSLDDDLAPLADALRKAGAHVEILAWDDCSVSWKRFDALVLRSTWDYTERLPEFLAWCEHTARQTKMLNPAEVVKWNTDKHYLADLAKKKCPVVESVFIEPGKAPDKFPDYAEFVVKPTVGAGSRDTQRYLAKDNPASLKMKAAISRRPSLGPRWHRTGFDCHGAARSNDRSPGDNSRTSRRPHRPRELRSRCERLRRRIGESCDR